MVKVRWVLDQFETERVAVRNDLRTLNPSFLLSDKVIEQLGDPKGNMTIVIGASGPKASRLGFTDGNWIYYDFDSSHQA